MRNLIFSVLQLIMVLDLVFSIIILLIVIYVGLRILKNIILGAIFVSLVFIVSFLLLGKFPNLKGLPIVGYFFSKVKFPSTTGEMIALVKKIFYNPEIVSISRDSASNLLVTLTNKGLFPISECRIFVDGVEPEVLNNPKKTLKKGESTIYELNWKEEFFKIWVRCKEIETYFET